jgi:hypothetical protein
MVSLASARDASTSQAFSCVEVYGESPRAASTRETACISVAFGALPSPANDTSAAASRKALP